MRRDCVHQRMCDELTSAKCVRNEMEEEKKERLARAVSRENGLETASF